MKYQVKDPQGQLHIIEGPEGATPDQVIAHAKKLVPSQQNPSFLQTMSNASDKIEGSMPYLAGLMAPPLGLGYKAMEGINNATGQLGQSVAEAAAEGRQVPKSIPGIGGKRIPPVPGPAAVVLGTGAAIASNPLSWFNPGAIAGGEILKPVAPVERAPAVSAAREIRMPLRRGEVTGGKINIGLSNLMGKTAMGSGPEEAFSASQTAALEAEKGRLTKPTDVYSAGQKAQTGMLGREAEMSAKRNAMFEQVPDNVFLKLGNAKKIADTLMDEQSRLYEGTHSPEVTRWADIVAKAESSEGKGVTGGPEVHGNTYKTPDTVIPESVTPGTFTPGKTQVNEIPIEQNAPGVPYTRDARGKIVGGGEQPSYYTVDKTPEVQLPETRIPERRIPGETVYDVKHSFGPEKKFAPKYNYYPVKKLRENLGEAIGQAKAAGKFQDYRDLTRLKEGLNKDIEAFASEPASPLDSMVAKQFKETYRKANAFSGAFKNLFKSDEAAALAGAPPEKIVEMVFKKNNETAIKQFRALAGEAGFLPAKQKFTQDLLESNNVSKELAKYEDGTLRAIYSGPELEKLKRYGMAQGIQKTVPNLQGTHGSARTRVAAGEMMGGGAGIMALLTGHPFIGAAGLGEFLAPAGISRLNLATREGVPYSLGGNSAQAMGATASAGSKSKKATLKKILGSLR